MAELDISEAIVPLGEFKARAEVLVTCPEMARNLPELAGSDLRELIEGSYR